jgi:hypothetical protein
VINYLALRHPEALDVVRVHRASCAHEKVRTDTSPHVEHRRGHTILAGEHLGVLDALFDRMKRLELGRLATVGGEQPGGEPATAHLHSGDIRGN